MNLRGRHSPELEFFSVSVWHWTKTGSILQSFDSPPFHEAAKALLCAIAQGKASIFCNSCHVMRSMTATVRAGSPWVDDSSRTARNGCESKGKEVGTVSSRGTLRPRDAGNPCGEN